MKLTAYVYDGHSVQVRPAPRERAWMSLTEQRYAYRCLPLNIANAHGWEILCPSGFVAAWNGGTGKDAIEVFADDGTTAPALSHFGHGVLTFHMPCLFRTEEGFDLMVQGPVNRPKDSLAPLSGIIETDWAPYSFTMNWMFTRPGTSVRFEKDEPYCHIFPVRRAELEAFAPQIVPLADNPELKRDHDAWMNQRGKFLADLQQENSPAREEGWQRSYFRGHDGNTPNTRLRLKDFERKS
jgi:hypothetical protein